MRAGSYVGVQILELLDVPTRDGAGDHPLDEAADIDELGRPRELGSQRPGDRRPEEGTTPYRRL